MIAYVLTSCSILEKLTLYYDGLIDYYLVGRVRSFVPMKEYTSKSQRGIRRGANRNAQISPARSPHTVTKQQDLSHPANNSFHDDEYTW